MQKIRYFEEFAEKAAAYDAARAERFKKRDELLEKGDYEGFCSFDEKDRKEYPAPYTTGQAAAYQCYRVNLALDNDAFFEIRAIPHIADIPDFSDALKKAGISKILITDESSRLMDGIFEFILLGWKLTGAEEYRETVKPWEDGDEETVITRGLAFIPDDK